MGKKIIAALLIILVVAGVSGYLFLAPAKATLTITDVPPEPYDNSIQAIYVTFTRIEVYAANAGNESGWYTIVASTTVDLLKNVNTSQVLDSAQVPAGRYTELRLITSEAIVAINGQNETYTVPSGSQTGIKVLIEGGGFQLYGGQSMNILLDMSFRSSEILSNPAHILNPVVSARTI